MVVCVATSERTWRNLDRYCFNPVFRAQRHRVALAVGFNGTDPEALRFIERLEPEHLFLRPNTGHDLANFDNMLKRLPAYEQYLFLHDDHWFHDTAWVDTLGGLMARQPGAGVLGNLVPFDVTGEFLEYYTLLTRALGYDEMAETAYPYFLQGLAGLYRRHVVEQILAMDGIPHLHRSVQVAAQVCERLFSGLLLRRGIVLEQIPPGFELYLVHRDHSIVKMKLEQAAGFLASGNGERAEHIFRLLRELRPGDDILESRIAQLKGHRRVQTSPDITP
jgi:hypothetical protein